VNLKLKAGSFYGSTAKAVSVSGFRFTEKAYELSAPLPQHSHELAHFCFVIEGSYTENIGSRSDERLPSTLIFYPPDVTHAESHHSRGRHFLIELEGWRSESMRNYSALLSDPCALNVGSTNWLAARIYREFRNMDELSKMALEGLTLELLVETSRRAKIDERRPPVWLTKATEILRDSFSNPPCLDYIADEIGIHPVHLARVFRQFHHCTMSEYVRHLRIDYARRRMIASNDPLVEIALAAGFADQTHFSRSFKRVTGMTPTEFRATLRES
jgi:AraC family transcriptional regulator